MNTKICIRCESEKSEYDFYFKDKKNNKRHNICKVCSENRRRSKEHYAKYKDAYIARTRIRNKKTSLELNSKILEYLRDHHCVRCGESDPIVLEFDHIDKDSKFLEVAQMRRKRFSWIRILAEIQKCQVLCANCHKRKTAIDFGWYKLGNAGLTE